ncbi:hypothetical protein AMTRI_Chr02g256830 [Amborella trichopoda]
MKADPKGGVKKIAEFIGQSIEEEEEVKKIVKMCSAQLGGLPNKTFFRKGVVGYWANHFTPETITKLD